MHNTVPSRLAPQIRKTSILAIALATFVILAFAGAILTHADTTPITTTTVTCNGVSGSSELVNLKIGSQTIVVAGTPNETGIIPGVLTLVINEQTSSSSGGTNSITVNAIDLTTVDGIRVIISSASSDITCVTTTPTTTTVTATVTTAV